LLAEAEVVPAVNQIECYPYLTQDATIAYCKDKGIYPEAWGPLGAGQSDILTNPLIAEIAYSYKRTPAQVALRWNLQRGVIVIPKSVHRDRQIENLAITNFELTNLEMEQINALNQNKRLGSNPDNFDF
jgi:diketogulonate reductase-like aldo/keto reductase